MAIVAIAFPHLQVNNLEALFIPHFPDELPEFGMEFAPTL